MIGRLLLLSLLVGLMGLSGTRAEDDDDAVAPAANVRQFRFTVQSFDQMVFGGQQQQVVQQANGRVLVVNATNQPNSSGFRKRMEALAETEIDVVDRRVSLTEIQKKKLKLAARGDTEQHISRANELRPKLTSEPLDQLRYTELMREFQPLCMAQQFGLLGETSLFRKTLRHSLTDEQRVRWQSLERERKKLVVESVIQNWDRRAKGIHLWGESRRKFVDVLLDHGDPPETTNGYSHFVVILEAAKLEDRLKPLVSEETWTQIQRQITQAKQAEVTLRASGQWPARVEDDEVADAKIDEAKD